MVPAPHRAPCPISRGTGPHARWALLLSASRFERRAALACAAALSLFAMAPAHAQTVFPAPDSPQAAPQADTPVAFAADAVSYGTDSEVVTASGNVVLRREGQSVRADKVVWDRRTGQVEATGNIRLVDEDGNQVFTDRVELTDELKAGAMENLLIVLRDGGRLAAVSGKRDAQGRIVLERAAYSGCPVEDESGCAHRPGRGHRQHPPRR